MQIAYSLPTEPFYGSSIILTIGNFDGMHLGHQEILKYVIELAKKLRGQSTLVTFINHPSTVLQENQSVPLLCTAEHKIRLIADAGIDLLFSIPFTLEFSQQTPDAFLSKLKHFLPFNTLILGSDATLGKDRKGDKNAIMHLSHTLKFAMHYHPDCMVDGERISSSRIRSCIQKGDLLAAKKYLGRSFSILAPVEKGAGRGEALGIHTANLSVKDLCLPPYGVYAVTLIHKGHSYPAISNLGLAPTFRNDSFPLLEVYIFDQNIDLYQQHVEIIFHDFIRPEQKYLSAEQLKMQIASDIIKAKQIFGIIRD